MFICANGRYGVSSNMNGMCHGPYMRVAPDGNVYVNGNYKENQLHGYSIESFVSGGQVQGLYYWDRHVRMAKHRFEIDGTPVVALW